MPWVRGRGTSRSRTGGPGMNGSGIRLTCADELGDPEFTVSDDTLVVAQTFRLAGASAPGRS